MKSFKEILEDEGKLLIETIRSEAKSTTSVEDRLQMEGMASEDVAEFAEFVVSAYQAFPTLVTVYTLHGISDASFQALSEIIYTGFLIGLQMGKSMDGPEDL